MTPKAPLVLKVVVTVDGTTDKALIVSVSPRCDKINVKRRKGSKDDDDDGNNKRFTMACVVVVVMCCVVHHPAEKAIDGQKQTEPRSFCRSNSTAPRDPTLPWTEQIETGELAMTVVETTQMDILHLFLFYQ